MTNHEKLKQAAKDAINALHGDTSVSQRETYDELSDLHDEIGMLMDALIGDMKEAAE
jgi:hypothetical protein